MPPTPSEPPPAPGLSAGLCSTDGFCWLEPLPFGNSLTGAFVVSPTEAWATGPRGAVLRYDGASWTQVPTGSSWAAQAVWAAGTGDVHVVGEAILRWNGTRFVEVHRAPGGQTYRTVHGSGPSAVWAAGDGGIVSRFDGTAWRDLPIELPAGSLNSVSAVFALGDGTAFALFQFGAGVHRFSGGAWQPLTPASGFQMRWGNGLWASSPSDLWVAGAGDTMSRVSWGHALSHFDGATWTGFDPPELARSELTAISGSGPGDVWAVAGGTPGRNAAHWDGTAWSSTKIGRSAAELHLAADGTGIAVGSGGAIAWRAAGGAWTTMLEGHQDFLQDAASRDGVAWVSGYGFYPEDARLLRIDATGSRDVSLGRTEIVYAISLLGKDDVWAATYGSGLAHWDGTAWTFDVGRSSATPRQPVRGVYAAAEDAIWALLGSSVQRWDGTALTTYALDAQYLERAWGATPDDLWAVGDVGSTHHWDGTAWTKVTLPGNHLTLDVWGRAANDVWIVGYEGAALHWDGSSWSEVATGTRASLQRVVGDGAGRVWAAADDGSVLEWDGTRFRALDSGTSGLINGAAWDPALGLLVAGSEGVLRRAP